MWACTIKLRYTEEDKATGGICETHPFSWINRREADIRLRDGNTFRGPASFLVQSIKRSAVGAQAHWVYSCCFMIPCHRAVSSNGNILIPVSTGTLTYTPVSSFNRFTDSSRWTSLQFLLWSAVGCLSGMSRCMCLSPQDKSHTVCLQINRPWDLVLSVG